MLEAIKLFREKTGLSLAAAKSAVEDIKKKRGI
jgi:ribosomal protein L7/L12